MLAVIYEIVSGDRSNWRFQACRDQAVPSVYIREEVVPSLQGCLEDDENLSWVAYRRYFEVDENERVAFLYELLGKYGGVVDSEDNPSLQLFPEGAKRLFNDEGPFRRLRFS